MNGKPAARRKDRGRTSRLLRAERYELSLKHEQRERRLRQDPKSKKAITALQRVIGLLLEVVDDLPSARGAIDRATDMLFREIQKQRDI